MAELLDTLQRVKERVDRYGSKGINEQDTKATLIQPALRSLGWDVEDLEDVQREYKIRKQDKPVDFALFLLRTPCLFVEAKGLGQNLDDRKWANQIMGYAGVAGVGWVVLTDGNEYRIYNSHAGCHCWLAQQCRLVASTLQLAAFRVLPSARVPHNSHC